MRGWGWGAGGHSHLPLPQAQPRLRKGAPSSDGALCFSVPRPISSKWHLSPFFLPTPTLSGTLPASDCVTSCLTPQRLLSTGCEKQSRYDLENPSPSSPSHPVGWALSPPSAPGSQGFSSNGKPSASCSQQLRAPAHSMGNRRTQAAAWPCCPHRPLTARPALLPPCPGPAAAPTTWQAPAGDRPGATCHCGTPAHR